jgi:hypothetical protein
MLSNACMPHIAGTWYTAVPTSVQLVPWQRVLHCHRSMFGAQPDIPSAACSVPSLTHSSCQSCRSAS